MVSHGGSAIRNLAIICGSVALASYACVRARADDVTGEVPQVQLASMGLARLEPISDAAGNQVRGNRAIFGGFDAIGIPILPAGQARLVARLNWADQGFPDLETVILCHLLAAGEYTEPIPPGQHEF